MTEWEVESPSAMLALGAKLAKILRAGDKVALAGDLGAGKTTLARGILAGLGYEGEVPSPTFAILQPYVPPLTRLTVTHADFYRIEDMREFAELGLDDILSDGVLIAEWPERLPDLYWLDALRIAIKSLAGDRRLLTVNAGTGWEGRWPVQFQTQSPAQ
ncbi:MAG: tRNA (adenosine(37)-N6)-threonylcarbamoyltransferase complex ATPase subunit type 1 TsaE [Parasphingorhabdus sp.]|nr:tRNA (adenosine(37)-N6)-threonylcarbamoyltransferase complex ATPase subunit type 1 TsaE [Parasphingorhabdus sp.]